MRRFRCATTSVLSARLFSIIPAAVLAGTVLAGCTTQKTGSAGPEADSAEVSQAITAEATVQAVDQEKRLVTLLREDGSTVTILAGPEVRNLPQIAVGDKVKASYVESLLASLKKPGEAVEPVAAAVAAGRAEPGARPGAAAGQRITVTVRIESVDTTKNIVVFTPPGGGLRAVNVRQPKFQEYIKGLKAGDQVEITYTEAVAISVEEPAREGE